MKFYAKKSGRFIIQRREEMENYLLSLRDGDYVLEISERKRTRSNEQNGYLFALYQIILTELIRRGYSKDEVSKDTLHEFFKGKFHYLELINEKTGEIERIPKKTSVMTTEEFSEFIENIKRWCAENLEIALPEPNEQFEI